MQSAEGPQVVLPQLMVMLWPYAMVLLPLLLVALLAWFIWRTSRRDRGTGGSGAVQERLRQLSDQHAQGLIDDDEYVRRRARILDGG